MSNQSSNNQEQPLNSEEVAAKLTIFVDNEGNIAYNCDWEPTEEGLIGVASIFYKILIDELPTKIFEEMKGQCVLNNAESDFMAIEGLLHQYAALDDDDSNGSVVVPPDKITNL
tara:strand:- start:3 stop:344 length:342 start_codon:yes stop_codon:yes gene_type:complete